MYTKQITRHVPFEFDPYTGYYRVSQYMICYTMGESLALRLNQWASDKIQRGNRLPAYSEWYLELPEDEKKNIERIDLNESPAVIRVDSLTRERELSRWESYLPEKGVINGDPTKLLIVEEGISYSGDRDTIWGSVQDFYQKKLFNGDGLLNRPTMKEWYSSLPLLGAVRNRVTRREAVCA